MLSASALLALNGCGSTGEPSDSGFGDTTPAVTPPVVPPVEPPVEPVSCVPDFDVMMVLGYPYQPDDVDYNNTSLNGAGISSLAFSLDGSVAYTITTDRFEPNQFVTIDPENGAGTIVGEAGDDDHISDLATEPVTGRLLGDYWSELMEVNIADGNTTYLGDIPDTRGPGGIAFAPDGTFYKIDGGSDAGDENATLYILDSSDGSEISSASRLGTRFMGLGFNPDDGKLYAANRTNPGEIYTIDPTDGNVTLVGSVDCPNGTCWLHDIDFHPTTGEMYGVMGGASDSDNPDDLVGAFVKWGCK